MQAVTDDNPAVLANRFCHALVENPAMTNATARIAAWLIGAAAKTGGFPLELSYRQITDGFERGGVEVDGTGARVETIKTALTWLEDNGYLQAQPGKLLPYGRRAYLYTVNF